jgi:hypothetical protein
MKLIRQLWDRTLVDFSQADSEELQAAYEEIFWFCYRNNLDPVAVLLEAQACPPSHVA